MILLDTCTFLWLILDQTQLSQNAIKCIKEHANNLLISAISAFEIGIKYHKKLLILPMAIEKWLPKALELHGVSVASIDEKIAITATLLPQLHRDPADRIIIATAEVHNYTIITPDHHLKLYPNIKIIW